MTTKFHALQPWLGDILGVIRRDIKTDYLPGMPLFYRTHFGNRPQNRLTAEEINAAFTKELLAGNEDLTEWVVNRWVFKHGEMYQFFAERLSAVNPDFSALEALTLEESERILEGSKEIFGPKAIYFFSILNGVVFPETVLNRLRRDVETEEMLAKEEASEAEEIADRAALQAKHERELSRLTEKYEQKLAGVLKKYTTDVEALKKQVRALQKR